MNLDEIVKTNDSAEKLRKARLVTIIGIILNLALASVKVTFSLLNNNLSLLADGLDSTLDIAATILGFVAISIAEKPADKDHHFGHQKFENLFSLGIAIILVASSGIIGYQAVIKLIEKPEQSFILANVIISIASIIVKGILVWIYIRAGKRINSPSLIANGLNFRTDIFTSAIVLISVSITHLSIGTVSLYWIDSTIALIISVIIIITAINIVKEAAAVLLDKSPDEKTINSIREIAKEQEGVHDIGNIRARFIAANVLLVDLDILLDPEISVQRGHEIACIVEDEVTEKLPVKYIQIHMEPYHEHTMK